MSLSSANLIWQRTSPVAVVFFLLNSVRQIITNGLPAMAVVVAAFVSVSDTNKSWMLTGLLGFALLTTIGAILNWVRYRFCVNDDKVLVRSGVLQREELTVEFGRIQNISIREPIYMRPFGLALLSIDTAGSGKKEIVLGGIRKNVALQLRETILSRTKTGAPAPLEEIEDSDDKSLLLSRDVKDIVIYGLTVNIVLWVVVAVGAFFGAFDAAENFFTWLANYIQIEDLIAAVERAGGMIGAVLIIILVLLVMFLLLPLISVSGALVRHYGYRLRVEGETYRKNSGLLTRHDESMKRHKIQAMVLKQNFVARFFKRTNMQLRIASAGSCAGNGQLPIGPKTTFLVPALNDDELTELVPEFLPGCDYSNVRFSRINRRRFSLVIIGWAVMPPLLLITGILILIVNWIFLLLLPIGLALAWIIVSQIWSKSGYGVLGNYGFIRHGFLGAEVTVFPLFKVQRVDIRQTPGQRRKKLAHLAIHLASHSLKISYVREQDARQFRDLALYHVESSNRAWY